MDANFSPRVKDVISFSKEEALRLGHDYIGTEHLMLGILREGEGLAIKILKILGVDLSELRHIIERSVKPDLRHTQNQDNIIPLVKQAERSLKITYLEAKLFKSNVIGTEHLLLSLLKDEDSIPSQALGEFEVDYDDVRLTLENLVMQSNSPRSRIPKQHI